MHRCQCRGIPGIPLPRMVVFLLVAGVFQDVPLIASPSTTCGKPPPSAPTGHQQAQAGHFGRVSPEASFYLKTTVITIIAQQAYKWPGLGLAGQTTVQLAPPVHLCAADCRLIFQHLSHLQSELIGGAGQSRGAVQGQQPPGLHTYTRRRTLRFQAVETLTSPVIHATERSQFPLHTDACPRPRPAS